MLNTNEFWILSLVEEGKSANESLPASLARVVEDCQIRDQGQTSEVEAPVPWTLAEGACLGVSASASSFGVVESSLVASVACRVASYLNNNM